MRGRVGRVVVAGGGGWGVGVEEDNRAAEADPGSANKGR